MSFCLSLSLSLVASLSEVEPNVRDRDADGAIWDVEVRVTRHTLPHLLANGMLWYVTGLTHAHQLPVTTFYCST